jgi:hypothetical protein
MADQFNPYAAPAASSIHPRAAEWLHSTNDPSLQKVARGLGLIYTSILVLVSTFILVFVGSMVVGGLAIGGGGRPNPREMQGGLQIVMVLYILGLLLGYGLNLVGTFMCLATPEETGAKGMITTSVIITVVSLVLTIVNFIVNNNAVAGVAGILSVIGGICFILFLKRLAGFIGALHLEQRARSILIALAVGVGFLILLLVLMVGMEPNAPRAGGGILAGIAITSLVLTIGGLVVFVMYANLINNLRKAIQAGGSTNY